MKEKNKIKTATILGGTITRKEIRKILTADADEHFLIQIRIVD